MNSKRNLLLIITSSKSLFSSFNWIKSCRESSSTRKKTKQILRILKTQSKQTFDKFIHWRRNGQFPFVSRRCRCRIQQRLIHTNTREIFTTCWISKIRLSTSSETRISIERKKKSIGVTWQLDLFDDWAHFHQQELAVVRALHWERLDPSVEWVDHHNLRNYFHRWNCSLEVRDSS